MVILYDDVRKIDDPKKVALTKLLLFLKTHEPKLVKFLHRLWNNQQRAITYKELREAIMAGYLTEEMLNDWRQDYSKFVIKHLAPAWHEAMEAANKPIKRNGLIWEFNADEAGIQQWTDSNAARFVTNCTDEQILAMREVIRRATNMHSMNVDTLSHVIRPMVGLDWRQAAANMNYFQTLIEQGVSEKKAVEKSIKYSAKQNRYRAQRIARTELAFSYNQGAYEGTKQAQAAGLLGHTVKTWCTALDERMCDICGSLEGKQVEMDQDFTYEGTNKIGQKESVRINPKLKHKLIGKVPPAHPHCRCTILYNEVYPPEPAAGTFNA